MRRCTTRRIACLAASLTSIVGSSSALADLTYMWVPVSISTAAIANDPALGNMQCWDLMVTTSGDWGSAGMQATLPFGGTFYRHFLGSNTRPNPTFLPIAPALEYSTYVTAPGDTGHSGAPIIVGGFPPNEPFSLSGNSLSVLWGDFAPDVPGTYQIARLTFPQGALPNVNQDSFATQSGPTAAGPAGINLGQPAPYPVKSWQPDADGDWNIAANWSSNSLPQLRQRILLDVGGDTLRTITHASGNTELHELRNFERIVLSGGTISTYVTEINGELLITAGGTFRADGLHHIEGSGVIDVGVGGALTGNWIALRNGVTLRGSGGSASLVQLVNLGGRIRAESTADSLDIQAAARLQSGNVGGAGAIRITGPTTIAGSTTKTGDGPLRLNGTLTIQGTSTLDVSGGAVVHDYTSASPLNDIRAKIISGYNDGSWNGTGINSSTAAGDASLAVGYAEASAIFTTFPATFMGETIDDTTLLVRLVRSGDANLDGIVNLNDFNRLASNFGSTNALWSDGDFTYDGTVNLADFNRLASNFGLSASPDGPTPDDWAALASAVPEPAMPLALVGLAALLARRHWR